MQWEEIVKYLRDFVMNAFVGGMLILLPLYLSILLLLKLLQSVLAAIQPIESVMPAWLPNPQLVVIMSLILLCFIVGSALRTTPGEFLREFLERSLLGRLPGYALFRGLAQRMAGRGNAKEWKPALAEIEDALVPAFVVEELPDGRLTVFVPSVPTPFAGAVYILEAQRVHLIDVPFTQAIKAVSQWGSGAKDLVAAMAPVGTKLTPS